MMANRRYSSDSEEDQLSVCEDYLTPEGCDRDQCRALHICLRFILGLCVEPDCEEGHDLNTTNNRRLLRQWNVIEANAKALQSRQKPDTTAPYLCENYNLGKCDNRPDECIKMHLCAGMIMGTCNKCDLNHDVQNPQCARLLRQAQVKLERTKKELRTYLKRKCKANIRNILTQKGEWKEPRLSSQEQGSQGCKVRTTPRYLSIKQYDRITCVDSPF